ncbi:MAG: hypothetical protein U0269_18815 [Polyangiales bacterium]
MDVFSRCSVDVFSRCSVDVFSRCSVVGDGGNKCHRKASLEDSRRVKCIGDRFHHGKTNGRHKIAGA